MKDEGKTLSEKVIRRVMRENGLAAYRPRKRKYSSYRGEISPAVPNLINRDFHADRPNEKWLTDIVPISDDRLLRRKTRMLDYRRKPRFEASEPNAGQGLRAAPRRRKADRAYGPGMPLQMAGMDKADERCGAETVNVEERLLSRQLRLRGLLRHRKERIVLQS